MEDFQPQALGVGKSEPLGENPSRSMLQTSFGGPIKRSPKPWGCWSRHSALLHALMLLFPFKPHPGMAAHLWSTLRKENRAGVVVPAL